MGYGGFFKSLGHLCSTAKISVCDWEEKDSKAIIAAPFNGANSKDGADHSRLHAKTKSQSSEGTCVKLLL